MDFYTPEADSKLMKVAIDTYLFDTPVKKTLEVGCSGGFLSKSILKYSNNHVACDINPHALKEAHRFLKRELKNNSKTVEIIESDLFEKVPKKKYDLIVFNPPYLPARHDDPDDWITKAIVGGKKGYEIIFRFLEELPNYLTDDGKCFLLFSSLSKQQLILDKLVEKLLGYHLIRHNKIMGEDLFVYEIFKSPLLLSLEEKGCGEIEFFKKGKRGKIFISKIKNKKVGIKVLHNLDAMHSIKKEKTNMQLVNKFGIGPKYIYGESMFIIYEFAKGVTITEFYEDEKTTLLDIKEVILQTLEQCNAMDKNGFEKKEMGNPYKHVIVNKKKTGIEVTLIDFERGVQRDRCKNVTQFIEYLTKSKFAYFLKEKGVEFKGLQILAREYLKGDYNEEAFSKIKKEIESGFN